MKHIVALRFLAFLTVSGSIQVLLIPSEVNVNRAIAVMPAVNSPKRDVFYLSKRFGFQFIEPSGYVIANATKNSFPQPNAPLQVLEIWKQEGLF